MPTILRQRLSRTTPGQASKYRMQQVTMSNHAKPSTWLTAKRLRAHGTILALCLWSVCLWNLSNPGFRDRAGNLKGTDFLHFYTLGRLAQVHDAADLYDINAQAKIAAERVPAAAGLRYLPLYPPQVSIFFSPLARLPYRRALASWWALNVAFYVTCCFVIWRTCSRLRSFGGTVLLLAVAFPAFFHLIAWGQTSGLALICFTVLYFALRHERSFLAGLAAGCLIFKPQLGLAVAVVFVSSGLWKAVLGALVSSAAELAVGVWYYGWAPLRRWIEMLLHGRALMNLLEPKPYQTHCLRTFWTMIVPWPDLAVALYIAGACGILYLTVHCWRRADILSLSVRYSLMLLATVLVAPHLTVYDLVILAPAFLLLSDWVLIQQTPHSSVIGTLLYFVFVLPLVGPLAKWTHVQPSVIAMAALLYVIWKVSRASGSATSEVERSVSARTARTEC